MKNYQYFLFDLDGTIIDSSQGIGNGVRYAFKKLSIDKKYIEATIKNIGMPLQHFISSVYQFDEKTKIKAVKFYRQYYKKKGIFENKVYKGIRKILEKLKSENKTICLATSKPLIFAKKILKYENLDQYFDIIIGSRLNNTLFEKSEIIACVLKKLKNPSKDQVVMIGDRDYDIFGAKINSIDCIGVTYGFGSRKELVKAGATYIVEEAKEIEIFSCGSSSKKSEEPRK
ncbi:hypothetical protein A2335_00930 [Candidatus Peregrinibacteria bacterium RIFOXYB2_FULL_32_7]|nr:MAG: hypothetical protein A2335_00930 [Candidatus Peregrinibacteria bacterium RIFOXYB2_FULL_32_7]